MFVAVTHFSRTGKNKSALDETYEFVPIYLFNKHKSLEQYGSLGLKNLKMPNSMSSEDSIPRREKKQESIRPYVFRNRTPPNPNRICKSGMRVLNKKRRHCQRCLPMIVYQRQESEKSLPDWPYVFVTIHSFDKNVQI